MEFISILNDVLGPVMRGPSSSHTAGSYHIGRLVRSLLGEEPAGASFTFDPDGSYAATYRQQGVDLALAAALLGWPITHFGKDRLGGFNELKGLGTINGFEVMEVPAMIISGTPVSSTKIRNALMEGNVKLANSLLGYDYSISGKVVFGNRIGRTIGFPTANIDIEDEYKLISAVGVYACRVDFHGRNFKGMGNIGYRPTIEIGNLTIEVNIFDFDEDIYGEYITIYFLERIRDEVKFENITALREQLIVDRAKVLEILK